MEVATWRLAEALAGRDRVVAVVEMSALPAGAVAVEAIANPAAMAVATADAAKRSQELNFFFPRAARRSLLCRAIFCTSGK